MTPDDLRRQIRRRAGVRQWHIPVRIVDHARLIPPTLCRLKRPSNTERREVVVSASWLRQKAPRLWADFIADRILGTPDRLTITTLKEDV